MSISSMLAGLDRPILFLKATKKKQIWIPQYVKADGTVVQGHHAFVHVSDDHNPLAVVSGKGSYTQKQAHAALHKVPGFAAKPVEEQMAAIMHHATELQDKASAAAVLSMFKKKIIAGQKPTLSEWKAYNGAPDAKVEEIQQAALAAGQQAHLFDTDLAYLKVATANPATAPATVVPEEVKPALAPVPVAPAAPDPVKEILSKIEAAKLPESNSNHGTVNSKLSALASLVEAGSVNAILSLSYGSNTYGQKVTALANQALAALGSEHKVVSGQKAGTHAALAGGTSTPPVAPVVVPKATYDAVIPKLQDAIPEKKIELPNPPPSVPIAQGKFLKEKAEAGKIADLKSLISAYIGNEAHAAADYANKLLVAIGQPPYNPTLTAPLKPKAAPKSDAPAGDKPVAPLIESGFDLAKLKLHKISDALDAGSVELLKKIIDELPAGHKTWLASLTWGKVKKYAVDAIAYLEQSQSKDAAPQGEQGWKFEAVDHGMSGLPSITASLADGASVCIANGGADGFDVIHMDNEGLMLNEGDHNFPSLSAALSAAKEMGVPRIPPDVLAKFAPDAKKSPKVVAASEVHKPAVPTPVTPQTFTVAYYENTSDGHSKFWSAHVEGTNLVTTYGKIGTKGMQTVKPMGSLADAQAAVNKAVEAKKKKGYEFAGAKKVPAAVVEDVPKDGDTKPSADGGTLVFKDGHWHKQESPSSEMSNVAALTDNEIPPAPSGLVPGTAKVIHGFASAGDPYGLANYANSLPFTSVVALKYAAQVLGTMFSKVQSSQLADGENSKPNYVGGLTLGEINSNLVPNIASESDVMLAQGFAYLGDIAGLAKLSETVVNEGKKSTSGYVLMLYSQLANKQGDANAKAAAAAKAIEDAAPTKASRVVSAKEIKAEQAVPTKMYEPLEVIDDWEKVGGQKGYNEGGTFQDKTGQWWYCKFPSGGEKVVKNELLASKLYQLSGVAMPDTKMVSHGGKVGIASKFNKDVKQDKEALLSGKPDGLLSGFAVDAWLANWDVIGNNPSKGFDNVLVDPNGKAFRIDAGGALAFGGAGGKKQEFGDKVIELKTMLDPKKNAHTAAVFGKMTPTDIAASVAKVAAISDQSIKDYCVSFGFGETSDRLALANKLIARKNDLLAQYPKVTDKVKKKFVFDPSKLGSAPDFLNWKGAGQSGPASLHEKNVANQDAVNQLFEVAKQGSIEAIKEFKMPFYDASGKVSHRVTPLEHPSQYVKGFAQQLINEIDAQLNPPKPFRWTGSNPLAALDKSYPKIQNINNAGLAKIGKYLSLGKPGTLSSADVGIVNKISWKNGKLKRATYSAAAQKVIAKLPTQQKDALKSYTGSGYHEINKSLWHGNPVGAAKSAGDALLTLGHPLDAGTLLSRRIHMGGAELDALLKSTGSILQEPAVMSTSIRPSCWSGNVQFKMTVGHGVKGLYVGVGSVTANSALSTHPGEDELILPPNTRLLVQAVKKSNGADEDGFGEGSSYVVEVLILPTT